MSTGPNYCSWLLNVRLPCCSCQVVSLAKGRPNLFVTNCECCFVNLITGFWLAPVDRYRITHNAPDRDRTCTIPSFLWNHQILSLARLPVPPQEQNTWALGCLAIRKSTTLLCDRHNLA